MGQGDEGHGGVGRTAGSLRRVPAGEVVKAQTNIHAAGCKRICFHVVGTVKAPQHGQYLEHKAGQEFALRCCWCGVAVAAISGDAIDEDEFERFPDVNTGAQP